VNSVWTFLEYPAWILGSIFADWLICGRLSALAPSVNYRYRPTVLRYLSLFIASGWIVYADEFGFPNETITEIGLVFLLVYAAFVTRDIFTQSKDDAGGTVDRFDF
jgi:hypothetical protein